MRIAGWAERYASIVSKFGYSAERDAESAMRLDHILGSHDTDALESAIRGRDVAIFGAGPTLDVALPYIKGTSCTVIVADSALGAVLESGITPDITVTDLDGEMAMLERAAAAGCLMVVHAHGDNMDRLKAAAKFRRHIGTTQAEPRGGMSNFGGLTDGDRAAFLASHFGARRIILFGMDFESGIGRHSGTAPQDRPAKLQKLAEAARLLEWLATFSGSELCTTSSPLRGWATIPLGVARKILG